tara:strand:- start:4566 stop:6257 length:1692 start_codon:yes stop_codon:yes gene_type:complete
MAGRLACVFLGLFLYLWINDLVTMATENETLDLPTGGSIAVVGNGPSLLSHDDGHVIDTSGYVVRFNKFVLLSNWTGSRTDLHVTTAGSPRWVTGRPHMVVYNMDLHEWFPFFPHPYTLRLRRRGLRRLLPEDDDASGPSSGLATTVFMAAVAPRSHVSTFGIGDFHSRATAPEALHYYAEGNGTLSDRVIWSLEARLRLHHDDESHLLDDASERFGNLGPSSSQCAGGEAGGTPAPSFLAQLRTRGFVHVRGVFPPEHVRALRGEWDLHARELGWSARVLHRLIDPTGVSSVDFLGRAAWYAAHHGVYRTAAFVTTCLRQWVHTQFHLGEDDIVFGLHSEVTVELVTRWGGDRLQEHARGGSLRTDHEVLSPRGGGEYNIFKVLVYLQDGPALDVVPGSHLVEDTGGLKGTRTLSVRAGGVVVLDQRLAHRGHVNTSERAGVATSIFDAPSAPRMLVTTTVAFRNTTHLDDFVKATTERQDRVFTLTERIAPPLDSIAGLLVVVFCVLSCRRPWRGGATHYDTLKQSHTKQSHAPPVPPGDGEAPSPPFAPRPPLVARGVSV